MSGKKLIYAEEGAVERGAIGPGEQYGKQYGEQYGSSAKRHRLRPRGSSTRAQRRPKTLQIIETAELGVAAGHREGRLRALGALMAAEPGSAQTTQSQPQRRPI